MVPSTETGGILRSWTYRGCCLHDDSGGAHQEIQFRLPDYRFALQSLTFTPLGIDVKATKVGSAFWIYLPAAEVVKLALCIWLPRELIYAQKQINKVGPYKAYLKLIAWLGLALLLVVSGKDLGTAMILFAIAGAALLLGDFLANGLAIVACGGAVLVGGLVITSPNRLSRIMATYQTCSASDMQGVCYQAVHGKYAMASEVCLEWASAIPEKNGDLAGSAQAFIFAIIGEETGFVGASLVICCFLVLGWCMLVVALQSQDRYITWYWPALPCGSSARHS